MPRCRPRRQRRGRGPPESGPTRLASWRSPARCGHAPLDLGDDHLDRDLVVPSARDDDVRVPLARLDELQMHRLDGRHVLVENLVEWTSALRYVPANPPDETDVRIGVDEHFDVAEVADTLIGEEQDPVDDDDVYWLNRRRLGAPRVRHEVVDRLVNRLAAGQPPELRDEELPIEGIWVVPVHAPPVVRRQVRV